MDAVVDAPTVALAVVLDLQRDQAVVVTRLARSIVLEVVKKHAELNVRMIVRRLAKRNAIVNAKAIVGELVTIHVLSNVQQIAATF